MERIDPGKDDVADTHRDALVLEVGNRLAFDDVVDLLEGVIVLAAQSHGLAGGGELNHEQGVMYRPYHLVHQHPQSDVPGSP